MSSESIAAAEDQYRIPDARTKLGRLERHQLMAESKLARIEQDVENAIAQGLRFTKPAMTAAPTENEMFLPEAAALLLQRDKLTRRAVDGLFADMVCPVQTLTIKQMMKDLRRGTVDHDEPLASLIRAMVRSSMKEV